jgi:hypothetical protein
MVRTRSWRTVAISAVAIVTVGGGTVALATSASAATVTTAWSAGSYHLDTKGVVSRSDIVLGHANTAAGQMMPLGNGTLGAATWNPATGFTAQLNRVDTLPNWYSPGWLQLPGLAKLTTAADFKGRVDLYNGRLIESGGGMKLTAYVRRGTDQLVIDVTGADPNTTQSAWVTLWNNAARPVTSSASGSIATVSSTWQGPGPAGVGTSTFGLMSAITAGGRSVVASTATSGFPAGSPTGAAYGAKVSFRPNTDGSFRVVVASPHWTGGNAQAAAATVLGDAATASAASLETPHQTWWHNFWGSVGLWTLNSADGAAQYLEHLRMVDLYAEASGNGDVYPSDYAGVAMLFRSLLDANPYGPGAWWHWNNRMQIEANTGAGAFGLNGSYFNLYTGNLANLRTYNAKVNPGLKGLCIPETMVFNGTGNNTSACSKTTGSASYNTRTITSGAEVGLRVWQQYLYTGDKAFLQRNYPLISESARFLLSYSSVGSKDGFLHTYPSNAHESQWDVHDPTTDIAAMSALFPVAIDAATTLGVDADLVTQLQKARTQIQPFPRVTDTSTGTHAAPPDATLCNAAPNTVTAAQAVASAASCDAGGHDMLWYSYDVNASIRNWENIGLEPVWPYGVIGDNTVVNGDNLTALARRTYKLRPNRPAVNCGGCTAIAGSGSVKDWSTDAIVAARLGLRTEFESAALWMTERFSTSPSAMGGGSPPFYEQIGTTTAALQEALVQDYDGLLRIAPAWPTTWNGSGTVFIRGGKVHVEVQAGVVNTVAIEATTTGGIKVRSPWSGQQINVVDGQTGAVVYGATTNGTLTIPAQAGHSYLVQRTSAPVSGMTYQPITGTAATAAFTLNARPPLASSATTRHIGIP